MKNQEDFQARTNWLRNLAIGDRVAVRSNNPGCLGEPPYHTFHVRALTETQGVISHDSMRSSGLLPDLKFTRATGAIVSSPMRTIELCSQAVLDANELAFLAYWSRYTVQDELSKLPVEAQREVYNLIRNLGFAQSESVADKQRGVA